MYGRDSTRKKCIDVRNQVVDHICDGIPIANVLETGYEMRQEVASDWVVHIVVSPGIVTDCRFISPLHLPTSVCVHCIRFHSICDHNCLVSIFLQKMMVHSGK